MLTTNSMARFSWLFIIGAALALLPEVAAAAGGGGGGAAASMDAIAARLCPIVAAVRTNIGKGIAVLGLIFLGIGAFFGKLNWGLAVIVGVGIIVIFGSATIADQVGGFTTTCGA